MPRARRTDVEIPNGEDTQANGASVEPVTDPNAQSDDGGIGADTGANADDGGGPRPDTGSGSGPGSGDSEPGGQTAAHPLDDGDPRIIRDEYGNPTFSPSGRLRKRRAGGPRSDTGATKAKVSVKKVPVDALTRLLMMGHAIGANLTRTPELEINSGEARMLADPLSELLVLYEVEPDPRIMAMMELGLAASYVYGPRFTMIRMRLRAEAMARRAAQQAASERTIIPNAGAGPDGAPVAVFQPVDITHGGPLGGAFNG